MSERDDQRQWELQQEYNRQKDAYDQQSYEEQLLDRIHELEAEKENWRDLCDITDHRKATLITELREMERLPVLPGGPPIWVDGRKLTALLEKQDE